ncbi:hypothetical protein COO60DRAFT_1210924 [Scenedesmus sp. NREL 46B-D3]|nr:hypothetical protein COO60DRAFT_1210924 [Scenedesmus sp. NREL 46B-D3]
MPAGRASCFCLWGSSSTIAPLSAQRCKSEQSFTPEVHMLHCIRLICYTAADLPHLLTSIADPSRCAGSRVSGDTSHRHTKHINGWCWNMHCQSN